MPIDSIVSLTKILFSLHSKRNANIYIVKQRGFIMDMGF
jgi:hypothetical protein